MYLYSRGGGGQDKKNFSSFLEVEFASNPRNVVSRTLSSVKNNCKRLIGIGATRYGRRILKQRQGERLRPSSGRIDKKAAAATWSLVWRSVCANRRKENMRAALF